MIKKIRVVMTGAIIGLCIQFCSTPPHTLKQAYTDHFVIGAAIGTHQIEGQEPEALALVIDQYNTITPENMFKFGPIHPEENTYNFEAPDRFVDFGEQHNMFIVGHTLVWHSQTSDWVFTDAKGNEVNRETLLARMQDHISTVVGRYKGRIHGWDVVNEAVQDAGPLRQTKWLDIIGEDYLQKAFEFAHAADPDAELYYNDYSLCNPAKRDGVVRLVKDLQNRGVQVDGIGMQGHWGLDYPSIENLEASILAFSELGCKVMITELDINVLPDPGEWRGADLSMNVDAQNAINPYTEGLPDSVQQKLTNRYKSIFDTLLKHSDKISRVTFWGTHDGHSWKNDWPVKGRTNYPLLFDRNYQPKPAYDAVMSAVQ